MDPIHYWQAKGNDGSWRRTGDYLLLSGRDTSLLGLNDKDERKIAVDEDHSQMVKFDSSGNKTYRSFVKYLQEVLVTAQGKVLQRNGMFMSGRLLEPSPTHEYSANEQIPTFVLKNW